MFASKQEELEQSSLQDAFTSLKYGNLDGIGNNGELMLECKGKGNKAFANGKRKRGNEWNIRGMRLRKKYNKIADVEQYNEVRFGKWQ